MSETLTHELRPGSRRSSAEELRSAGALAGEGLAGVVGVVADTHHAIALRVEKNLPPSARPVAAMGRIVAGGIYAMVGAAHRGIPMVAAEVAVHTSAGKSPVADSAVGRAVLPIVNGFWGDRIARDHPSLAVSMAVRVGGDDLPLDRESVARAFPDASGHVVVFMHGLMEDERVWTPRPPREDGLPTDEVPTEVGSAEGDPVGSLGPEHRSFGDRLELDLGVTSVHVRYNTGEHISSNGHMFATLLADLAATWPVAVERVSLVGHSMGGLVIYSACEHASRVGHTWVDRVSTVVALGSPHLGAPLEKVVHVADWALRRTPETAPHARILGTRSGGIRDLRHGAVVEEDWADDEALLSRALARIPQLPHVTYCFVSGTLTRSRNHPVGHFLGDGMVRRQSAAGRGRTREAESGDSMGERNDLHLDGVHHFVMQNHDAVYPHVLSWIGKVTSTQRG